MLCYRGTYGWAAVVGLVLGWTGSANPVTAQESLFSANDFAGLIDVRAFASETDQPSWIDGGYGRGRFASAAGATLGEAVLVWRPRLSDMFSAHVNLDYQPQTGDAPKVVEAYVTARTPAGCEIQGSARIGSFFPSISLEHDDLFWTTTDTITPSAINSWTTEEVLLTGMEATVRRRTPVGTFAMTGAIFGANDTAGALLAFRGWALHDVKAGLFATLPLPTPAPGRSLSLPLQSAVTRPTAEVDGRAGYFGKLEWRGTRTSVALSHYDNAGNRTGLQDGQYAWETRFTQLAVRFQAPGAIEVTGQALAGRTRMGPSLPQVLYDADFSSAYLMAGRAVGPGRLTVRTETFRIRDNSFRDIDDQDEDGWAVTAAWIQDLRPGVQLRAELQTIDSRRPGLAALGLEPDQSDVTGQTAIRFGF